MFRLAQYAFRASHHAIKRPALIRTYLSDAYQAFDKWDETLSTEILQKTNISMYNLIRKEKITSFFSSR